MYATASPAKNQTTNVRYRNFGFNAIPANASITSVTVSVEWKVSTTSSIATLGSRVYTAGTARGSELVDAAEPTSDTTRTYAVSGLTRADLLDGTFEVNVRASRGNFNTAFTASLDAVSVTVGYTVPAPGAAPTYDDNGNMTSDGSYGNRAYTYDALGRLTGVSGNGVSATYTLDGAGNRWAETVNGVTTAFDLDLAAANPTVLADGTRRYLPGAPGAGYEQGGTWWTSLADLVGSPLLAVSETGSTTAAVRRDPYGAPRPGSTDPLGIGYAGEWKNATGLLNLRFRQYDPVLGRFIGRDTFGGVASAPQTANRYAYALGNPLRNSDPSGHFIRALQADPSMALALLLRGTSVPGVIFDGLAAFLGHDPFSGRTLTPWQRLAGFMGLLSRPTLPTAGPGPGPAYPLVGDTSWRPDPAQAGIDSLIEAGVRATDTAGDDFITKGQVLIATNRRLALMRTGHWPSDYLARARLRVTGNVMGGASQGLGYALKVTSRGLFVLGAGITVYSSVSEEVDVGRAQGRSDVEIAVRGFFRSVFNIGGSVAGGVAGGAACGLATAGAGGQFVCAIAGAGAGGEAGDWLFEQVSQAGDWLFERVFGR